MEPVIGVFSSWGTAERAANSLELPEDQVSVIQAGHRDPEETGIGAPLGAAVGGAVGAAAGSSIGAAVASMVLPGVGPVVATGVLAALLFGAGGAAAGAVAGDKAEQFSEVRPPSGDSHIYKEALLRGRVLVVAHVESPEQAEKIRSTLRREGAESAR